jgi:hypothetical protein
MSHHYQDQCQCQWISDQGWAKITSTLIMLCRVGGGRISIRQQSSRGSCWVRYGRYRISSIYLTAQIGGVLRGPALNLESECQVS